MRLFKPVALATTIGICAMTGGGDANGSTGFTLPTSLAAVRQDATAVCDRIPGEARQAGLPALIVPDDGGPILLRVATMTEGIGARVRNAR
ncbi:hypothetical protein [Burkholderia vietnamiensis]|uniref:hypothetical protein n=1 Tax=Burkholderia vietnamiensis TaxID=60552 RepID=UPI001CF5AA23|nr:hypothetical protein [Burkholderia vietnamiensis]MCA8180607.1 hypothetical protein [Burkholderia vietnamiensis]